MIKFILSLMMFMLTSSSVAQVVSFDPARTIHVVGTVDFSSIAGYAQKIYDMSEEKKPIYLVINSGGGSVMAGTTVIDAIEAAKSAGSKVHCLAGTLAASMAFQFFVHCSERYAFAYTKLMFHSMTAKIGGRVKETSTYFNYLSKLEKDLKEKTLKELKIPVDIFEANYAAETFFAAKHLAELSPNFMKIVKLVKGVEKVFLLTE